MERECRQREQGETLYLPTQLIRTHTHIITPSHNPTHTHTQITKYHAASKKATECSPIDTLTTERVNYFNNAKSYQCVSTYDRTFHVKEGYSSKLKRDDREHTQGLNVHAEENQKQVPVLTSSVYGHRDPLEHPDRKHVRVGLVKRDFYRSCGTNMTPSA